MERSLLTLADITHEEITEIIARAEALKPRIRNRETIGSLENRIVGLLFEKPSTRTRSSFETATLRLGGSPIYEPSSEMQLKRGEPIKDTARILGSYMDALVARVYGHDHVTELADWAGVPVINALSDFTHPTQIICDFLTIKEVKHHLDGIRLAYIGDGNNVCNSLLFGAAKVGMNITAACPRGYEPVPSVLAIAKEIAAGTGAELNVVQSPQEAAANADVLYTDVWVSMGEDAESDARLKAFGGYQINEDLLTFAASDASVMHCLPAHRGLEITDEVIEGPQSIVWQQGENKLHGAAAILEFYLAGGQNT